ncbi:MAG: UDP-N-acetylglucosamine 2-epimerase (non-hydrolyzing) [Acidobacteria bacterium]|nr:UDP-N-acetylglucosamine 2-epimerase (non-hydrolyzing) [Acidobacteriota bacterium]
MPVKILHVVGARPNFVKAAPVLRALAAYPRCRSVLVHTGQHYDREMSSVLFADLGLPDPDEHLGAGGGTHAGQTAEVMVRLEPVLLAHRPDLVVVFGDVNSTLAAALVAAKLGLPIAHVEAGLRSFDRTMPEEINRVVTDLLAGLHFTPTADADDNLRSAGIAADRVHLVGNVMADTLLGAVAEARARRVCRRWGLDEGGYGVLTLHRAGNVDDPATLSALLAAAARVAERIPLVFPVHPRTRLRMAESGLAPLLGAPTGLCAVEPLGYLDFVGLLAGARLVLTDSGGVQAESTIVGVPCVTLRERTEWVVTVECGGNQLAGTDPDRVLACAERALAGAVACHSRPPLWDGRAAKRIAAVLARELGLG